MVWATAIAAAASVASEAAKKSGRADPGGLPTNNRTQINVAPVGVNLGEITKHFQQAPPANGGFGFNPPPRQFSGTPVDSVKSFRADDSPPLLQKLSLPKDNQKALMAGTGIIAGGLLLGWMLS